MRLSERHLSRRHRLPPGRSRGARRAAVRRLSYRMAAGSVMAAVVVGLTAAPALALTWKVFPGGNFSGADAGSTVITDTTASPPISVTCTPSKITGHLNPGLHPNGLAIGTITTAIFTSCNGGFAVAPVPSSLPWALNAIGYSTVNRITSGTITGIQLTLTGPSSCTANLAGTIHFRYSNNDYGLKFIPAATGLNFSTSGCGFTSGDAATYVADYYPITPHQKIVHP